MSPFAAHLPAALRLLRSRANLTQAEVESKGGIGQGKLSEWETGQTTPRLASLEAALGAMDMNLHHLADALDEVQGREVRQRPATYAVDKPPQNLEQLRAEVALRMADMMAAALRDIHEVMTGSVSATPEDAPHERRRKDPPGAGPD